MTIRNTSRDEKHPEWVMGGNPRAIEAQESRGQQQLVHSSQLPTQVSAEDRKKLEEAGVIFEEETPGDPLFCQATLPSGWIKRPTDHSMWSELVDDQGVVRAHIFYKAAFYNRSAHMRCN